MASVKFKLQDQQQLQWEMFHNVPPKTKELTVLKVSDKTSWTFLNMWGTKWKLTDIHFI
jgi:hypothetical protein